MEDLYFSIDSALLRELGEKLVETVHVALSELVKNAYDADATQVEIIFEKDKKGKSQIRIVDDGVGMSLDTVKKYWMRVATTNKAEKDVSSVYGRPLTGAKGIGRFSCRRLGNHLKLITYGNKTRRVRGKHKLLERTEVDFPWDHFAPGTEVTKIKCKGQVDDVHNESTGTTLVITDIAEEWGTQGLNWMKRQLAVLAANRGTRREGYADDPGFNIRLIAPDFEGGVRDLRVDLMKGGWGTIKAYINSQHQAVCELEALGVGRRTIKSSTKFPALNDVKLEVGIMVDDRWQLRDTTVLSLGTLKKILPDWGGVQVRFRGFRVFPFGDDDWLEIDYDRGLRRGAPRDELFAFASTLRGVDPGRSLLNLLSMRSYVGNVEIGKDANGFEMKLNREGFVQSEAVEQLKKFTRFCIDWATILRDFHIRQEAHRESYVAKVELEELINSNIDTDKLIETAVNTIQTKAEEVSNLLPIKEREEFRTLFFKATDAIRKQNDAYVSELAHLRLIASTATLVLIFSHEVRTILGLLETSRELLEGMSRKFSSNQQKEIKEVVSGFEEFQKRLTDLLDLTSIVGIDHKSEKPGQIALKDKVAKVVKVFDLMIKKYFIQIDYSKIPNNIAITNILEAEVYSMLLNVLSNSVKAVIAGGKNRKIEVSATKDGMYNVISIKDTGVGIEPEKYEEVFIPFISDPDGRLYENLDSRLNSEDKLMMGTGSGLGLGIVREIVNAHNGTIQFKFPGKSEWKSFLEIKLP